MNIQIKIHDIEKLKKQSCPNPVVPALYKNKKLIAYGQDIIEHFNRLKNESPRKNQ